MSGKIILIDHHDNPRDDLATVYLTEMGFDLELVCPFKGDLLPEITTDIDGAVIYGGAQNITELDQHPFLEDEISWLESAIEADFPMLGICLGAQLIAHCLGAEVSAHHQGQCEFGYYRIDPTEQAGDWLPAPMYVTQAHYQQFSLPQGATRLATASVFENQAFRYGDNIFGVQFHPEVNSDIFRRWQDSDWAFYDRPGAQTRQEQDSIICHADAIQREWFYSFLDSLFSTGKARSVNPQKIACNQ
jgi:GMP synthase (glutamine-hydrolysing)